MYRPYIYYCNSNSAKALGFKPTLEVCAAFVYLALEELGKVIWILEQEKCKFSFLKSLGLEFKEDNKSLFKLNTWFAKLGYFTLLLLCLLILPLLGTIHKSGLIPGQLITYFLWRNSPAATATGRCAEYTKWYTFSQSSFDRASSLPLKKSESNTWTKTNV